MTKKQNNIPATADIKQIPGTRYVLIDGKRVARLLTPTDKAGTIVFNLFVKKGEAYKQLTVEQIAELCASAAAAK